MKFEFGNSQARAAHGPCAELGEHLNATHACPRSSPPPARIISSIIASHHTLTHPSTPFENIQRPQPVYIRGSGNISTPDRSSHASTVSLNECCALRKKTIRSRGKMGLSKTKRILVLLAIDTAFFFLELVVGMKYKLEC